MEDGKDEVDDKMVDNMIAEIRDSLPLTSTVVSETSTMVSETSTVTETSTLITDKAFVVAGNVDAGKSTLIGTLISGLLDDGRGSARRCVADAWRCTNMRLILEKHRTYHHVF
jgi:GTPase